MSRKLDTLVCLATVLSFFLTALIGGEIQVKGRCSLAEAITAANTDLPTGGCPAGSGPDVIILTKNVVLDSVDNNDADLGDNGLPTIVSDITIRGNGHTIRRSAEAPPFRFFLVGRLLFPASEPGDLTLENLVLSNGHATPETLPNLVALTCADDSSFGGALFVLVGEVQIIDSVLEANRADCGGAIANVRGNTVEIVGGTVGGLAGNVANRGGAIFNDGLGFVDPDFIPSKVVTRGVLFVGNEARTSLDDPLDFTGNFGSSGSGGAIGNAADFEDVGSRFVQNRAGCGGAITNNTLRGQVLLTGSVLEENTAGAGGAIHNHNAADVEVQNAEFRANQIGPVFADPPGSGPTFRCTGIDSSQAGGAIANSGSGAFFAAHDSLFVGNTAGRNGGAIFAGQGGPAEIFNSVVEENVASLDGGGVYADIDGNLPLAIVNSRIGHNVATDGAGIAIVQSTTDIRASQVVNNSGSRFTSNGGGLHINRFASVLRPVSILDSTIAGNQSAQGAGIWIKATPLHIEGSTISGNQIVDGIFRSGAGIHQADPFSDDPTPMRLLNSTVSGNSGASSGGGIHAQGNVELINSSIIGNSGSMNGGVLQFRTFDSRNSIIAGNTATGGGGNDNCRVLGAGWVDSGNNLDSDGSCDGFTQSTLEQLALEALADNGGATLTHALGAGSVAIDGVGGVCPEVADIDQRLAGRDALCDIGSFEAGPSLPTAFFVLNESEVEEGSGLHSIDFSIDNTEGNVAGGTPLTLYLRIMGSATPTADYTLLTPRPLALKVPAPGMQSTEVIEFDILEDLEFEGDETIEIAATLVGPAHLDIDSHVVTILDNEELDACAALQAAVQDQVGNEDSGSYRSHGQYVSAVNRAIEDLASWDRPTAGCRGCIVNQFARSIPIEAQSQCVSRAQP